MYSAVVLILTLVQALIVAGSYFMGSSSVFLNVVVYGSPFYLLMTMISSASILVETPIYMAAFIYHVFKYYVFFKAQLCDDSNWRRNFAIVLEAGYLALTGYYLN
jgi:hypothetical protein